MSQEEGKSATSAPPAEGEDKAAPSKSLPILASPAIESISAIRFSTSDPELWFTQIDGLLHVNRITSDLSKYYTIITALDPNTLHQIADVAKNPPASGKYDKLKKELIARFGETKERQLLKLVTGLDLSGRRPSQLLREVRNLAGANVSDDALTTLWMQRMPDNVRCIISVCKGQSLENLSEIADRVIDNSSSTHHVMSTSSSTDKSFCDAIGPSKIITLEARISALETAINQVIQKLSDISVNANMNNNRPSRNRSRSQSQRQKQKVCYYHIKFGASSRKCHKVVDIMSTTL
ncbi:uncharacterized protein LOC124418542 [Lucilia cuprina]|uniref:uncharacterized protein LOC124418542 n=1 Tax=Lucilia cuprina TaxID=7375 RepID=UPI001F0610DD|nr:uncharacterized protein LOC124418542 [Lucilia cuprina]